MLNKQRDDCSTSSNQEQKACRSSGLIRNLHSDDTFEEEIGSFCDSGQGAWSELSGEVVSNLSESVVSLASFDVNQRIHSVCTGTVIESNPQTVIRIVTSASLITSNDDANNIFPNLGIQVHLPNGQDVIAWMIDFDLHYNVILVGISYVPGIQEACLDRQLQFESQSKVVAIWRSFNSGKLMATAGTLIDEPSEVFPERLMSSTCKISTFGIGGPLVDFNGNFLGVNLYATEKTTFLPRNKLCEALVCPGRLRVGVKQGSGSTIETSEIHDLTLHLGNSSKKRQYKKQKPATSNKKRKYKKQKPSISSKCDSEEPEFLCTEYVRSNFSELHHSLPDDDFTKYLIEKLKLRGYPLPIMIEDGLRLLNGFEEEFAGDIWSKLTKEVAFNLSQSVVSLASFHGGTRFFACTGVLIGRRKSTTRILTSASLVRTAADANTIADNLEIEVYLPNNQCTKGTLQHYNLNYNVAVVSISDFHCRRTAKFHNQVQVKPYKEVVVAIGRFFETGKLMATSGTVTRRRIKFDCKHLMVSTCKITKAGIGGPLIDFNGNFIGMNFYDMEQTPYLPGDIILKLLRQFDAKGAVAGEVIDHPNPNRWPVPEPRWYYPSSVFYVHHPRRMLQ